MTARARGVTLLEVLMALAVAAILATLALPSMGAIAQRQRLAAAAEALAADLAEARLEAARSGQMLHVQSQRSDTDHWCWAVATQLGCGCDGLVAPLATCRLKAVQAADYPGIRLLQPVQARLDPQGLAQSTVPGMVQAGVQAVELQSPQGERLRVELGALGRSRVCVPGSASGSGSAEATAEAGTRAGTGWRYAAC